MKRSKIKLTSLFVFLFFTLSSIIAYSQGVEIQGDLKVSQMPIDENQESVVVRAPDGTLKTRSAGSLNLTDTVRTLITDIELATFLCNCSSVPPFLIESALAAGYSIEDLLGGGVSIIDLINGGSSIHDLLNAGQSVGDLINAGVTVQVLLDGGVPPIDILNGGANTGDFIGLLYEGGMIFYISSSGTGLISALNDQTSGIWWGPIYSDVGVYSTGVGTGETNTAGIISAYGSNVNYAAYMCDTLSLNGYTDWFLPSRDELAQMFVNLADSDGNGSNSGPGDSGNLANFASTYYWSSSEVNNPSGTDQFAWVTSFIDGLNFNSLFAKINSVPNVRAIRSF